MEPLVEVAGLRVTVPGPGGEPKPVVQDVAFTIAKGEVVALIGESGSGKTTIALSLLGHAREGCRIAGGTVRVAGVDVLQLGESERQALRGRVVAYVAQSAAASFNPSKTILEQVIEPALVHGLMDRAAAEVRAVELFRALALPGPDSIGQRYPHQVSGGQLQRMIAAMALITDPALVVFDEPTTALDVTTQIDVLRAFKGVLQDRGVTAVYVSHDLAVVSQMADRIIVLRHGEVRESGSTRRILETPSDVYTRELVAAARAADQTGAARPRGAAPLLEIRGLTAGYGGRDRLGMPAKPVLRDIDLAVPRGTSVGVIGESGSGKSTLAHIIAGLLAPAQGSVRLDGEPLPPTTSGRTRDQFRRIQLVFQNADTALNPAHSIARILGRPLAFYHQLAGEARDRRIGELLDMVRLPAEVATRRPGELSGGQKQRINLARAFAAEPEIILCDEVTSALDPVVAAAIIECMAELRRAFQVSYLFISHDIGAVERLCDEVVVLYAGRKLEEGQKAGLRRQPRHPYTRLLVNSVPEIRPGWLEAIAPSAGLPALHNAAAGGGDLCVFLDRCPLRIDGVCNAEMPPRVLAGNGGEVLCHRGWELTS